jgi:integrase
MKLVLARQNCLLLRDDGTISYPLSKFLTDRFSNPHTREQVAQSLRIFYRFCCANRIDLAHLALDGRCLCYEHARQLVGLCFRPLPEIESLSDKKVVLLTCAKSGKAPKHLRGAVSPNTADKRLNHIALYMQFFREVFLDPVIRSSTLREQLRQEYEKISNQLRRTIGGTKQGHHHDIKSLPSDKFLAIVRAVFLRPEELFNSETGKVSRNVLRDRAMVLLACEGLRPGTIGNVARRDFRPESRHLAIKDNRSERTKTTTSTPVLKLGASTAVNSASETMIELWPITVEAIQNYLNAERVAILSHSLRNRSRGFLFLNEKGQPIKHRASITNLFNRLGKRLGELGLLDIGSDPYFKDQKQYDFHGYVLRHSSGSLFLELKGTDARTLDSMKTRYGWTMNSKQPERYGARALSDQANLELMKFNADLMAENVAKRVCSEANDGS